MNIREQYLRGNIFNIGDIVLFNNQEFTIKERGTNYLFLEDANGNQTKKWLQDVEPMDKYTPSDKIKIARIIADAFGVEPNITHSSPEEYINTGLKNIKTKPIHPDHVEIIKHMLTTAKSAGIDYDDKLSPFKDSIRPEDVKNTESDFDTPTEHKGHTAPVVGSSLHGDETNTQLRRMKIKYKLKEEQEPDDDDEISDADIDKMVSHVDDLEDIIDAYDDDELHIVDHEGKHVSGLKEELMLEVLSRQERIRASIRFAQTAGKRERRMQIALHTRSSPKKINHRARVMAEKILKMRIIKKPLDELSLPEKERLERILQTKKDILRKLALKLAPKIKAIENKRLHPRDKK